jgi:hypothetical protein
MHPSASIRSGKKNPARLRAGSRISTAPCRTSGNFWINLDALAKTYRMAKQKFRPTRLVVFSGVKAYI